MVKLGLTLVVFALNMLLFAMAMEILQDDLSYGSFAGLLALTGISMASIGVTYNIIRDYR